MLKYLIVCPLVFIAGFIDAIAGGGGLISLPAYIFAGLPVHTAIATNKMSSCMGTAMATLKYALNGYISLKISLFSAFFALAGSYIGANIALSISDSAFKVIMLIIIPFIAFYVFRQKDFNAGYEKGPRSETAVLVISMISALIIGVYDGFYGPGTGTFLLLILTAVGHMPLSEANGTTKVINLTTNAAALTVYLVNGKVLLPLGLAAGCFNIAGNYLGSQSFSKNGSKIARPVMISVLIIFFVKIITELI